MLARNIEGERDPDLQSKASMANSDAGTSSGNARGGQYEVFLSFCGRDTRKGFTSVLHRDLVNNGIHAFIDNEELPVGEEIGALLQAIDDSQIYIPIFSQNYASREWCLRELKRMVDNTHNNSEEKKILPIFYDVEPKDVNLETSLYETAIQKHEQDHKENFPHEVESWKEALKEVRNIKGWELSKYGDQAELLDLVVKAVLQELKIREKSVTKHLVGLDGRKDEALEKLDVNSSDKARLLVIHGMGGIGKSTLAKVIYNELYSRFGKCCAFLDDIRETSKKEGLVSLQKKLLRDMDSSSAAKSINDVDYGRKKIGKILGDKKALIVLDDVDEKKQIENLIGQDRLHPRTRIIITTRNTNVLEIIEQKMAHEMKETNSDHALQILPYEMEEMNFDYALQLFNKHAFFEGSLAKDFESLSRDIVFTTGGLPLALEVIGSLLFRKPKAKWEDTLNQLKKMPHECVKEKLMISYEALNYRQREIFLDVACFFINEVMTNAKYMWEACEFYPNSEIDVLVEMSLIKIKDNERFWMHDQLRDLGREIVRRGNPENVKKWSRVWTGDNSLDFVRIEEMCEDVEALDLRYVDVKGWIPPRRMSLDYSIRQEDITRFKNLRFLRFHGETLHGDFIGSLPKLRWISWCYWSSNLGVPSVHAKNLVVLELYFSRLEDSKIGELFKMATKLKSLAFENCRGLTRTPDLSRCLDLERLTFHDCYNFKEIDRSIGKLTCLLDLNIISCRGIECVPDEIGRLVKLERFSLCSNYRVSGLPTSVGNLASLRKLDLSHTTITSLPDSIGKLKSLRTLDLSYDGKNSNRWELPKAFGMLEKLEELNLYSHENLVGEIPNEIGYLSSLRVLNLGNTKINRVPRTINMLSRLSTLYLANCDEIKELPELPVSLVHLRVVSRSLQVVPNLSKLTNLVELELSDGSNYGDGSSNLKHKCDLGWIGRLSKLKKLKLCLLNIASPPTELGTLSLLEDLTLRGLDLQPLERLPPSLLSLQLRNFSWTGLPLSNLEILSVLKLCSLRLREIQLYGLSQLQDLHLDRCDLQSLSIPSGLRKLRIEYCDNMNEIQFLGMSASLEELSIEWCDSIERMVLCSEGGSLGVLDQSESSSSESTYRSPGGLLLLPNVLKKLKRLKMYCCLNLLEIQVIGTLSSLQVIFIKDCDAMEKFSGVSNLKNLHHLDIHRCSKLRVVEGLNELEFLTKLYVPDFPSLETSVDISNSKIPDECVISIHSLFLSDNKSWFTFKDYKIMAQQGAPQSEKNKEEAKMEGHAVEPNNKLQPQCHPSASSRDHEISKEPPSDNVKEGTPPEKQNQMTEQDSYPISLDELAPPKTNEEAKMEGDAVEPDTKLQPQCHPSASSRDHEISKEPPSDIVKEGTPPEKQNQMTEQDSYPISLDELAPPKTFCDRFKTCLVGILECVCNRDFP